MKVRSPLYASILAGMILTAPIVALTQWIGWWALLADPFIVVFVRLGYWAAKRDSK